MDGPTLLNVRRGRLLGIFGRIDHQSPIRSGKVVSCVWVPTHDPLTRYPRDLPLCGAERFVPHCWGRDRGADVRAEARIEERFKCVFSMSPPILVGMVVSLDVHAGLAPGGVASRFGRRSCT